MDNRLHDDELSAFVKVYKQPLASIKIAEGEDLHQQFADELLLPRQEAKVLCHKINYYHSMGVFFG